MKYFSGLVLSIAVAVMLFGCEKEAPQQEVIRSVRAIKVTSPDDFAKRWFPGQAKATQQVELSFRVAGPLIEFPVDVGDRVTKGRVVARIDPRDYQVDLRNANGRLEEAKAVLARAETDANRLVTIQKKNPDAVSQSRVDRSRQVVESTRAEIRSLGASVDAAGDKLSYTYLKAPFDGIVSATYVENYEDVTAKQPILRLIDHSKIEMIVNIPENIISHADMLKKQGEVLIVRFDPFPGREIKARIKEIGSEASKTTRTYPVTLIMDQPEDVIILPGMAGKASSTVGRGESAESGVIVIPETSVFSTGEDKNTYVWVVDDATKKVHQRVVKTGDILDSGIAISDGIIPGETIVTAGVHYLKEGQEIRILGSSDQEVPE
jgi:RND family efflux transporter MFP subunit